MTEGSLNDLRNVNEWLGKDIKKWDKNEKLVISGNMDGFALENSDNSNSNNSYNYSQKWQNNENLENDNVGSEIFSNAVYLENNTYIIHGFKFYGLPNTPKFVGGFQLQNENHECQIYKQIPNDIDVLISHGPPKGILDITSRGIRFSFFFWIACWFLMF